MKETFDSYDKIFCDEEKDRFCKVNGIDRKFIDDLFEEINKFAKNTNTIGNYMPCPDAEFNDVKGGVKDKCYGYSHFQDRLEKLYYYLEHDLDKENEKRHLIYCLKKKENNTKSGLMRMRKDII